MFSVPCRLPLLPLAATFRDMKLPLLQFPLQTLDFFFRFHKHRHGDDGGIVKNGDAAGPQIAGDVLDPVHGLNVAANPVQIFLPGEQGGTYPESSGEKTFYFHDLFPVVWGLCDGVWCCLADEKRTIPLLFPFADDVGWNRL